MKAESDKYILQPGLNLMTLLRADLEEGIAAASGAGFEFVELWVDTLERYLKNHAADDLRRLLNERRVRVLSIGDIESITFCNREQFAELISQCARFAAIAREIECPVLVVSGSVKPKGVDSGAIAAELKAVLGKLLDVVEPEGVGLALAFRGFPWCSVNSLAQAVEAVGHHRERRLSLALDTFDLHAAHTNPQAIEALDPNRISILRLADCANIARPILTDTGRLLPGEGVAELGAILQAVINSGYSGVASLKVLSSRLLDLDSKEIARVAMAAARPYFTAAHTNANAPR